MLKELLGVLQARIKMENDVMKQSFYKKAVSQGKQLVKEVGQQGFIKFNPETRKFEWSVKQFNQTCLNLARGTSSYDLFKHIQAILREEGYYVLNH